ncbi:hypothetical protein D3C73_899110 [compost metagenome]
MAAASVVGLPMVPLLEAEPFGATYSAPDTGVGVAVGAVVAVAVGVALGAGVAVAVAVGAGVAVLALDTIMLSNLAAVL